MSNLETLTSRSSEDILSESNAQSGVASPPPKRCTPDLVQDLPLVTNDISPIGSYCDPSHNALTSSTDSRAGKTSADITTSAESSAETFANSDGTIVRIKSPAAVPSNSSPPKFIGTSVATHKELTSFRRSISTSSAPSSRETSDDREMKPASSKSRVNTVTGRAIEVRTPSIPSALHTDTQKLGNQVLNTREAVVTASHSLPTSPNSDHTPPFPSVAAINQALSLTSHKDSIPLHTSDESSVPANPVTPIMAGSFEKKFDKPRPPVKTKPKPPALLPKPKK